MTSKKYELPADMLDALNEKKSAYSPYGFLDYVISLDWNGNYLINELQKFLHLPNSASTQRVLMNWFLHPELVEFVPKKESKFVIEIDAPTDEIGRVDKDKDGRLVIRYYRRYYRPITHKFTEEEADEIVAGLTALNARKVKVED